MSSVNEFFLVFLATILLVRIFLFVKPVASPTIGNFRMHHYMYGILFVIVGLVLQSLWLYAIGLGLFVDELAYLLIRGKTHADNHSVKSLIGTAFFIIVFVLRSYISVPIK